MRPAVIPICYRRWHSTEYSRRSETNTYSFHDRYNMSCVPTSWPIEKIDDSLNLIWVFGWKATLVAAKIQAFRNLRQFE